MLRKGSLEAFGRMWPDGSSVHLAAPYALEPQKLTGEREGVCVSTFRTLTPGTGAIMEWSVGISEKGIEILDDSTVAQITEIRDSIAPPAMLETMRTMREEGVPGKPGGP